jgi:hypothetical protein
MRNLSELTDVALYLYSEFNTNPNAISSDMNITRYYLSRSPQTTNLSHEEKIEGWLGNTNGIDRHALGEFVYSDEDFFEALENNLPDDVEFVHDAIIEWLESSDEEDYEFNRSVSNSSISATWEVFDSEDDNIDVYPRIKDGWVSLLYADNNITEREYNMNDNLSNIIKLLDPRGSEFSVVGELCTLANISNDIQSLTDENSEVWAFINIEEENLEKIQNFIEFATQILEIDNIHYNSLQYRAILNSYIENYK